MDTEQISGQFNTFFTSLEEAIPEGPSGAFAQVFPGLEIQQTGFLGSLFGSGGDGSFTEAEKAKIDSHYAFNRGSRPTCEEQNELETFLNKTDTGGGQFAAN
jgi:hypothetical protein